MSGPRLVYELLADAGFMSRLENAWSTFTPRERAALLELAELPRGLLSARWLEFDQHERQMIVFAARRVIEFGRLCARLAGCDS